MISTTSGIFHNPVARIQGLLNPDNQYSRSMIIKTKNSLRWFEFPALSAQPGIAHGIFTRHGGRSHAPYDSLNVGGKSGDSDLNVRRNRELIREELGFERLARVSQAHGDRALTVDEIPDGQAPEADALISGRPGTGLLVQVADCQPVLLYDPSTRVVANIHSGWRGSLQNIVGAAVERMAREFGAAPERMLAGVGPSLGPCCAEFRDYERMLPELWLKYHVGHAHFDFWSITADQLVSAGLRRNNIEIAGMCSKCGTDNFFSYRAEKVTGRFAAVIGLV